MTSGGDQWAHFSLKWSLLCQIRDSSGFGQSPKGWLFGTNSLTWHSMPLYFSSLLRRDPLHLRYFSLYSAALKLFSLF
jgi:hypothetical protein